MWLYNQASSAARSALIYITVGTLIVIWTGVWYTYMHNNPPESNSAYYWCTGFLITGLALVGIGFGIGSIGQSARQADMPPAPVVVDDKPLVVSAPAPVATGATNGTAIVPDPKVLVSQPQRNNSMPVAAGSQPRKL
jgi:hypothetical protein